MGATRRAGHSVLRAWRSTVKGDRARLGAVVFVCFATVFGNAGPTLADAYITSGISGGPSSLNGFSGLIWTPFNRFDDDGPLIRAWSKAATFSYRTDLPGTADQLIDVSGINLEAEAGWQWRRHGIHLALLGGIVWRDHQLSPSDPGSSLAGSRFGWSVSFDADCPLWNGLGIMANGNYVGPIGQYWIETRPYFQLEAGMRVGSTLAVAGGDNYLKARAGAFITGYTWQIDAHHRVFFGGEAGAEIDPGDGDLAPFVGVHIGFFY